VRVELALDEVADGAGDQPLLLREVGVHRAQPVTSWMERPT
jgi:hypothetical protein